MPLSSTVGLVDGLDEIARPGSPVVRRSAPSSSPDWLAIEIRLLPAGRRPRHRPGRHWTHHTGLVTAELLAAAAAVARGRRRPTGVAQDRRGLAGRRRGGAGLPVGPGLWAAVLADRDGDRRAALTGPPRDRGRGRGRGRGARRSSTRVQTSSDWSEALYHDRPTPFLRRLVEDVGAAGPGSSPELVEQLTDRELLVLRYLPSRLSNADIADAACTSR